MPRAKATFLASDPDFVSFPSRRSVVHSTNGIVACTQPLAAQAGQRILSAGGNAADAAVAVAAALNMTEPSSTGIGGDMFCLFYNAKTKKVHALNGSGRSGSAVTLADIRKDLGIDPGQSGKIPMSSVHAVTTPGAAAGWVDTVEKFGNGKLLLEEILMPAIELGENGFPVAELAAYFVSCRMLPESVGTLSSSASGLRARTASVRRLQTLGKCSSPIAKQRMEKEPPSLESCSTTQLLPTLLGY
jgi:gamma-glutamyltranspeptidase/glutathione hydrolase